MKSDTDVDYVKNKRAEFKRKHTDANWFSLDGKTSKAPVTPRASYREVYRHAYAFTQAMHYAGFKGYAARCRIWRNPIKVVRWCAPRSSETITLYGRLDIGVTPELRCYIHGDGIICAFVKTGDIGPFDNIEDDQYLVEELLVPPSARRRIVAEAANGTGLQSALFKKFCGVDMRINAGYLAFARMGLTSGSDDPAIATRFCVSARHYGFPVEAYLLEAVQSAAMKALNIPSYT